MGVHNEGKAEKTGRPGPKTPPVGVEGKDWEAAMGEAMKVKKPAEGWPDHGPKKKGRKDSDPDDS